MINSEEKRVKTQTFLESTFNTKIARKLTLESKKSLQKKPDFKANEKKLKKKMNNFEEELNAEWIEKLFLEFNEEKEKNMKKSLKNTKEIANFSERNHKENNAFPSGFSSNLSHFSLIYRIFLGKSLRNCQ